MLDNMSFLENQASADPLLLLGAGLIMIVTLWTSKRALSVSKTELSLSSQDEGGEQYGATNASRGLVRMAMAINSAYEQIMPQRIQHAIAKRFEPLTDEEREGGSYDLIRATVNLTTASILISIATSLKLPLSTTYVCFMVSMGSSLADRAWGRESAVYRISGVLTVVSGWFITGFGAMLIAFVVGFYACQGRRCGNLRRLAAVRLAAAEEQPQKEPQGRSNHREQTRGQDRTGRYQYRRRRRDRHHAQHYQDIRPHADRHLQGEPQGVEGGGAAVQRDIRTLQRSASTRSCPR